MVGFVLFNITYKPPGLDHFPDCDILLFCFLNMVVRKRHTLEWVMDQAALTALGFGEKVASLWMSHLSYDFLSKVLKNQGRKRNKAPE
ncbi:hypothetical protein CEXT_670091 [Caerostris extrusa]|uniref:Uncharacterized protein n=1 Tax=Caerostris extrusa TaxID=172846 RepID=A0AAV4PFM7_CAEEX|nr:hypothetical protein CEXT_670091 [Caerostris extrusa]